MNTDEYGPPVPNPTSIVLQFMSRTLAVFLGGLLALVVYTLIMNSYNEHRMKKAMYEMREELKRGPLTK